MLLLKMIQARWVVEEQNLFIYVYVKQARSGFLAQ